MLMLGRLSSTLDLVLPDVNSNICKKQRKQKRKMMQTVRGEDFRQVMLCQALQSQSQMDTTGHWGGHRSCILHGTDRTQMRPHDGGADQSLGSRASSGSLAYRCLSDATADPSLHYYAGTKKNIFDSQTSLLQKIIWNVFEIFLYNQ